MVERVLPCLLDSEILGDFVFLQQPPIPRGRYTHQQVADAENTRQLGELQFLHDVPDEGTAALDGRRFGINHHPMGCPMGQMQHHELRVAWVEEHPAHCPRGQVGQIGTRGMEMKIEVELRP
jgi:hypothetical protein